MYLGSKKLITPAEYLEREVNVPSKNEFYDGKIVLMVGGMPNHNRISADIVGEARALVKAKKCSVFTSDQRVKSPDGR